MTEANPNKSDSDLQLLALRFRISDPLNTLSNLTTAKPDPDIRPKIVGYYDEKPFGGRLSNPDIPFLWCCHCQKRTHWKGYVVDNGTGVTFMIGSECGKEHYGADFEAVEKTFRDQQQRQQSLKSYLNLLHKISGLDLEISKILNCSFLQLHDKRSAEFAKAAPHAFKALKKAAEKGSLEGIQRVRDFNAEQARDERYKRAIAHYRSLPYAERKGLKDDGLKPEKDDEPIFVDSFIEFGRIFGASIFGLHPARKNALDCRAALNKFKEIELQGTDKFSSQDINNRTKFLINSCRLLRDSLYESFRSAEFFDPENIARLCRWSECHRQFSCSPSDNDLLVCDAHGKAYKFVRFERVGVVQSPIIESV